MRMQRTSEETHGDGGLYKPWSSILEHFKGDTDEALVFAEKRRKEDRGTSTCRNTGVETFLLYGEESINWTTKKTGFLICNVIVSDIVCLLLRHTFLGRSLCAI